MDLDCENESGSDIDVPEWDESEEEGGHDEVPEEEGVDEWSSILRQRQQPPAFKRGTGARVHPIPDGPNVAPDDLFSYLWPDSLWDMLVLETNRYAAQRAYQAKGHNVCWRDVTRPDMQAFLAICILMGILRLPNRDWYWRKAEHVYTGFGKIMSKDRFIQIWRNLHLCNNEQCDASDKLYKLRPFLDIMTHTFSSVYMPNGFFSIDESMVRYKGRLAWRQFMPNKPVRFGIKLWSLCESVTGYMYNFQIYTGKPEGKVEKNLSARVVKDLLQPLFFSCARVCFDNFYTGFELLKDLFEKNIYAWGTVRAGRKDLPKDLLSQKLPKHNYLLAQRKNFLFCTWQDTKKVNFLSNFHPSFDMGVVKRRGMDIQVPKVIEDYQKHMGGVDLCDQNVSYYMGSLKSTKWWRRVFFYFLHIALCNTFIFAKSANPHVFTKYKCPTRLEFIEQIANRLIGTYNANRREMNLHLELAPTATVVHDSHTIITMFKTKKVCQECKRNRSHIPSNRRVTLQGCKTCRIAVHSKCHQEHFSRVTRR